MAKFKGLNAGKPNQKHVLDFTTQLAVMIRAGINLRPRWTASPTRRSMSGFKKVILQLKNDVEAGKQFSDAIAKHPKLFNPLYINMVGRRRCRARSARCWTASRVHRPADRDAEDGGRRVDLSGDHRHAGGRGDGLPADVRAAEVLHVFEGKEDRSCPGRRSS
jgi:hypothetical protein